MRILHLLDHSPPRRSDYSRRVMAILRHQRALGWKTCQLTGPAHGVAAPDEGACAADWQFFRTPARLDYAGGAPRLRLGALLNERVRQVVQLTRPDILHAHSPAALAFAALRVGRHAGLPVLFEAHAPAAGSAQGACWMPPRGDRRTRHRGAAPLHLPWLDAILPRQPDSAFARFSMRAMEAWAARRAGAVVTNSEGMRLRLLQVGVPAASLHVVADAVEAGSYRVHGQCRIERRRDSPALSGLHVHSGYVQAPARVERRMRVPHASSSPRLQGVPVMLGFSPAHIDHHLREQGEFEAEATLDSVLAAVVLLNRGGTTVRLLLACGQARHPSVYRAATRHGLAARCSMRSSDNLLGNAPASTLMELYPDAPLTSAIAADKLQLPTAISLTASLHARADIMIFPQSAINSAAGPPRQLLQAMARGCIVAAANTAAHREVIEHGRNGVLFAPNDAGALADAVKVLLDAAPRWPDMRASARWLIDYHRNWEGCVAMYGPIYEKLLKGKRRR